MIYGGLRETEFRMTATDIPTSGYVTTRWVRERYAISNSTLYEWIKAGRLPKPIRIGPRAVRMSMTSLLEFEAKLAAPHVDAAANVPVPDEEKV